MKACRHHGLVWLVRIVSDPDVPARVQHRQQLRMSRPKTRSASVAGVDDIPRPLHRHNTPGFGGSCPLDRRHPDHRPRGGSPWRWASGMPSGNSRSGSRTVWSSPTQRGTGWHKPSEQIGASPWRISPSRFGRKRPIGSEGVSKRSGVLGNCWRKKTVEPGSSTPSIRPPFGALWSGRSVAW